MTLLRLSLFSLLVLSGCGQGSYAESGDGAGPAANASEGSCCGAEGGCCAGEADAKPTGEGSCCAEKSAAPTAGDEGSCCAEAPAAGGTTAPAAKPFVPRFTSGSGK